MKHELTEESELAAIAGEWQIPECTEPEVVNGAALPHVVTGAELYAGRVVRLRPLIEGLIWDGLTMIVAKPKAGKSWLMLQCAVDIAGGPAVSGVTALDHGPVLYGAFEEPEARTMARLRNLAPVGDWAKNLHFVYDLLPLMGGGSRSYTKWRFLAQSP